MKCFLTLLLLSLGLVGCSNNSPSNNSPASSPPAKDNSAVNGRDKNGTAKTPIDQNENKDDLETTRKIREEVLATKMSFNAHNVKIITQNGEVTLRGPVNSAEEKQKIEDIARNVAGKDKVVSQLEVEPKP